MNQAGLAECIVRAVNSCHPHLHPVLYERYERLVPEQKFGSFLFPLLNGVHLHCACAALF